MKNTDAFFIASLINLHMEKGASVLGGLGAMAGDAARFVGRETGPALDRGFGAIGRATMKIPRSGIRELLTGGPVGSAYPLGTELPYGNIGRSVASRVGLGAGLGAEGINTLANYRNNVAYEDQQQHPIQSWLSQHLRGTPKLHHHNYLLPSPLQG